MKRYSCSIPTSRAFEVVRHPVVRPVLAMLTLLALVGAQTVLPMAALARGVKGAGVKAAPPAKPAVHGVAAGQRGALKASAPLPCGPGGACDVTVRALDLSRPPTEKELRQAGQFGGALSPIGAADVAQLATQYDQELKSAGLRAGLSAQLPENLPAGKMVAQRRKKIERLKTINLDFGRAMQAWNAHHYRQAAPLFEAHLQKFADSPWAGEAALHLGCDAKYNGRFAEAQARYANILQNTSADPRAPSHDIHQKAKLRWADLDIATGHLDDATKKLANILQTDRDWRRRTWAQHWMITVDAYKSSARDLRACGTRALAVVLASLGKGEAAAVLANLQPQSADGFSLQELARLAARYNVPMRGFRVRERHGGAAALAALPMPVLIHYDFAQQAPLTGAMGANALNPPVPPNGARPALPPLPPPFRITHRSGHFLVVNRVDTRGRRVYLFDPQEKRRYALSFEALEREWSGTGLALAQAPAKPPRIAWLTDGEMARIIGGCCGVARPPRKLGDNPDNIPGNPGSSCGAPVWSVNPSNLNFFVTDTPLWYRPPIGPNVSVTLSYNSQDATSQNAVFGNKWVFNFGSYLVEDTATGGGVVTIFMPDGRQDNFYPDSSGGYVAPAGLFNTLRRVSDTRWELEFERGGKFIYDIPAGTDSLQSLLVEVQDAYGQSLRLGYDTDVHLTTITDAQGKITRLSYDALGHIVRAVDPFDRQATFAYDGNGNLIQVVDMAGNAFQYAYDDTVHITQLNTAQGAWQFTAEEPDGNVTAVDSYPAPGGPTWQSARLTITDPMGQQEEYFYFGGLGLNGLEVGGLDGNQVWHVDKNHYVPYTPGFNNAARQVVKTLWVTGQTIDGDGKITAIYHAGRSGDPNRLVERIGYDAHGLPAVRTDVRGKTTTIVRNAHGQPIAVTDPAGRTTRFIYNDNGIDLLSVVDSTGRTLLTLDYNDQHQPLNITDLADNTSTLGYTAWGAPAVATDPSGTTTLSYDPATKRLISVARNSQTLGSFTYDAQGRVSSRTDAGSQTLRYEYNDLNKPTRVTYPDGTFSAIEYVCCNLPGVVTDRSGTKTFYDYDPLKRLIRVQDSDGKDVHLHYDKVGNLTELLDTRSTATRFAYDDLDRPILKSYADGTAANINYDVAHNIVSRRDAQGKITRSLFDDLGRLSRIDYPTQPDVTFTYDTLDRLTQMTDGLGTTRYGYDALDRLASIDGPWPDDTITYHYDALGRRDQMQVNGTAQVAYAYDSLHRLQSLSSPAGTFTPTYEGATARPTQLDLPNGTHTLYGYDALKRPNLIQNLTSTGQNISRYNYGYDAPGYEHRDLRTSVEQQLGSDPIQHIDYGYDSTDQLTGEVSTDPVQPRDTSYAYDAMGNRTGRHDAVANLSTTYTNNRLNQHLSVATTHADNPPVATVLEYDARGNLTSAGSARYLYDDSNRLSQVLQLNSVTGANQHKSQFLYDAAGRKRIVREYTWDALNLRWNQQEETRYLYDGLDVIQERDGNNQVTVNYTRVGNIGGLLARSTADGHFYYHYDGAGNVTQLTDSAQNVVANYVYDAYGNTLSVSGPQSSQPYRFSTKALHAQSGLYDYGFRFYSPGLGRWINRDPIQEAGGLNLYGFVANSPLNWMDPYGLMQFGFNWMDPYGLIQFGLGLSNRNTWLVFDTDDAVEGWYAAVDGLNIAGDPLADAGYYDRCDKVLDESRELGQKAAEALIQAGTAGFFNAGSASTFWSTEGGFEAAQAAQVGRTLEQTLGGRVLDIVQEQTVARFGKKLPMWVWRFTSSVFAMNAKGEAHVFLTSATKSTSVWNTVERPMLESAGVRIIPHFVP